MSGYVIGVDPGNASMGVSLWTADGQFLGSQTWNPWLVGAPELYLGVAGSKPRIHVWVETPSYGTPVTREGIAFAGGMAVNQIVQRFGVKRRNVHKVKPGKWRRGVGMRTQGKSREQLKAMALRRVELLGIGPVGSDDEAEAVLIGLYGTKLRRRR